MEISIFHLSYIILKQSRESKAFHSIEDTVIKITVINFASVHCYFIGPCKLGDEVAPRTYSMFCSSSMYLI